MPVTLQVIYPNTDGTSFDYGYFMSTHMGIVGDCIGEHIQSTLVSKGIAGGPDTPPGYHAIASIVFANQEALDEAMGKLGPVLEDVPNYTNSQPQVLIGERLDG